MTGLRIAVDTGGTFTDVVMLDPTAQSISTAKVPSTPQRPDDAFIAGLRELRVDGQAVDFLGHGTTVAINALVQRKGARTGLITTRGFRDVLEIQRTNRPDMYNLYFHKPKPLVPRNLRVEIGERIMADGSVAEPLNREELAGAVEHLREQGVEAIAICFLNSYVNAAHEEEAAALIRERYPDIAVTASCEVAREWREYERSSTAALNSYLMPSIRTYLEELDRRAEEEGFGKQVLVTKSDGGLTHASSAGQRPATMLMSGPAAGVLGAAEYGRASGFPNLITFDIGGTTCDVSLIRDGRPPLVRDRLVDGYAVLAPFVDVYSIGAGGGTIAWSDVSGFLRVGPHSAGAYPGPACYDRGGTEPTVTDAYLLLGLIDADAFLGGAMPLSRRRAEEAFERLAARVDMSVQECARGTLTILDHAMVAALRVVSIERGHDPRDFTLMAFGGAGALHLGSLGRELGIPRGIVPRYPSLFSAWGILTADIRHSYAGTINRLLPELSPHELNERIAELQELGERDLRADRVDQNAMRFAVSLDMRYAGQEHNVNIECPPHFDDAALAALRERFHQAHEQAYTYRLPAEPVAVTNLRLDAIGLHPSPEPGEWQVEGNGQPALKGTRDVLFDVTEGRIETPIYERDRLGAGAELEGPCIVEEPTSTTVLLAGQRLTVDRFGNLVCDL